jgi:hypothetical protein
MSGYLHNLIGGLTIASQNQELIFVCEIVHIHIGQSSYDLALRGELSALLKLEIADRTREGKISVNTTKIDESACRCNSTLLG